MAGTCPPPSQHWHPFPKDASWKHPCQISFCIQDTSLYQYFTTFPCTQYHFIMFLSSYPSGNSLETTCGNQTTQLISKWFRCLCTILSTNWEMISNTMFYFFFARHHGSVDMYSDHIKRAPAMLIKPRSIQDILLFLFLIHGFKPFELSGLWRLWGKSDLITCWIPLEITLVGSCPYKS